ncbi:hypothetical protein BKA67DRAFT_569236 [Truncatella angustata]|uniref:Fucose-specific lectin n=1 Tax=Truncatella angustata TaxID=152316 RepID=A0A9P8UJW6_9PEZI|nr:uncharacterized protein BKA67DRAFT_569236 [Truncatella angustata]KAH6653345.1 hypothetical protein BKA67DRAFT_569236 [Truncatella angustata]
MTGHEGTATTHHTADGIDHQQPGLEVNYPSGLEVDTRYTPTNASEGLQAVYPYQDDLKLPYTPNHSIAPVSKPGTHHNGEGQVGQNYDDQLYYSPSMEAIQMPQPKKTRKFSWIVVGAVAILVVLGAVLGGVLGSRAAKSSTSSDVSGASGNSTTNSTLTNIRSSSRLAVSGWRDGSVYRIRLFYQGQDQRLRMSTYASNESSWSDPISLTGLEYAAGDDTPLAASDSVQSSTQNQYKLYYLDRDSILRGHGFVDKQGAAEQGSRLELNDYPITIPPTSRLAAYWPFIVSQDSDGAFRWIRYWGSAGNWWTNSTLDLIGSASAAMVVLPASAWYLDKGGFAYRRSDGKMRTYLTDTNNNATGEAWGTADLSESIPSDTAIGGFAVARPNDSNNQTNTYLLYQDDSGTVQVVWQDDTSGWKGPSTYSAFDNADNGTDITCLTPAAWDGAGVEITSNQNMNRCYFQVNNKVREVYYDGSNWNDQGYLPIT